MKKYDMQRCIYDVARCEMTLECMKSCATLARHVPHNATRSGPSARMRAQSQDAPTRTARHEVAEGCRGYTWV